MLKERMCCLTVLLAAEKEVGVVYPDSMIFAEFFESLSSP